MNFPTICVLAVVILLVVLALRSMIGRIKRGDLCGTCGNSCGGSCGHCQAAQGLQEADVEAVVAAIRENEKEDF